MNVQDAVFALTNVRQKHSALTRKEFPSLTLTRALNAAPALTFALLQPSPCKPFINSSEADTLSASYFILLLLLFFFYFYSFVFILLFCFFLLLFFFCFLLMKNLFIRNFVNTNFFCWTAFFSHHQQKSCRSIHFCKNAFILSVHFIRYSVSIVRNNSKQVFFGGFKLCYPL